MLGFTKWSPLGLTVTCSARRRGRGQAQLLGDDVGAGWHRARGRTCCTHTAASPSRQPTLCQFSTSPSTPASSPTTHPPTLGDCVLPPLWQQRGVAQVVSHHDGGVQGGKIQGGHWLVVITSLRWRVQRGGPSASGSRRGGGKCGRGSGSACNEACGDLAWHNKKLAFGSSTVAPSYATPSLGSPPFCRTDERQDSGPAAERHGMGAPAASRCHCSPLVRSHAASGVVCLAIQPTHPPTHPAHLHVWHHQVLCERLAQDLRKDLADVGEGRAEQQASEKQAGVHTHETSRQADEQAGTRARGQAGKRACMRLTIASAAGRGACGTAAGTQGPTLMDWPRERR